MESVLYCCYCTKWLAMISLIMKMTYLEWLIKTQLNWTEGEWSILILTHRKVIQGGQKNSSIDSALAYLMGSLGCEMALHRLGVRGVRYSRCFEMSSAIGDTNRSGWNGTCCSVQTLQHTWRWTTPRRLLGHVNGSKFGDAAEQVV